MTGKMPAAPQKQFGWNFRHLLYAPNAGGKESCFMNGTRDRAEHDPSFSNGSLAEIYRTQLYRNSDYRSDPDEGRPEFLSFKDRPKLLQLFLDLLEYLFVIRIFRHVCGICLSNGSFHFFLFLDGSGA